MSTYHETWKKDVIPQHHVLLVEDEVNLAKGLAMVMEEEGCLVDMSNTGRDALAKFDGSPFDLLIADLRLPDIDGMEVIRHAHQVRPSTRMVVITGYPSISTALQAVKLGASDYLRKPFTDDEFLTSIHSAMAEIETRSMEQLLNEAQQERLIQREEVIRVLERASSDHGFWRDLMENASDVLHDYHLSNEAKAAIYSGDLQWIRRHVGELSELQLTFIYRRLEREAW
jgi:ActR/RegA family two-component response regulator